MVEERTKDRKYNHRLMDYNNDSTTHLADVHKLFADALVKVRREETHCSVSVARNRLEVRIGQLDRQRPKVLTKMLDRQRARNRQHGR